MNLIRPKSSTPCPCKEEEKNYDLVLRISGCDSECAEPAEFIDELMIDQIAAQCRKLLPVIAVKVLDNESSIQREFALIKVKAKDLNTRSEIIQIADIFRANVIDVSRQTLTVAVFGGSDKTTAILDLLKEFGILEVVRTGTIAIERGRSTIYDETKLKEEYNYGKNVL